MNNRKAAASHSKKDETDLLQLSSDDSCDDEDLPVEKTALRRIAVIDTLNVLHENGRGSKWARVAGCSCDAIGILLLCWKLLKQDFDLRLFIPDSYMTGANKDKVANHFVLERMQRLGYLTTIRDHAHDDLVILEYAKCTGGFIISNDRYRDHEQTYSQFMTKDDDSVAVIKNRVVRIRFQAFPPERLKGGKHALATASGHGYLGVDFRLMPGSLAAMYALNDQDPSYGIVFAQRVVRKQRRALNALNDELSLMCEWFRQELCQIHGVKPPTLPYFDPAKRDLPSEYEYFVRLYKRWTIREKERAEDAERERQWELKHSSWDKADFGWEKGDTDKNGGFW